jgi:hypothetical protein
MMHLFSEVVMRERQELAKCEAEQANARRLAAARPQHTNRPDRMRLLFRR